MRVVVTGSAGFVGSHTVRALEERGVTVIRADRKTGTDLSSEVEPWRPIPDAIIHLASACSTLGSIRDPMETFRDTVLPAVNVLEVARKDKIPVIVTSSVKARDGMTPYGAAKRMVEWWASEYGRTYFLPVIINRPGTIYGPGQDGSPESGWIAWFCKARDEGLQVTINGDGRQKRDLLHVSDYIRLMLLQLDWLDGKSGLEIPGEEGSEPVDYTEQIWDVGGGKFNTVSVYDMAIHLGLSFKFGPSRYGDAESYIGVNDIPGWHPKVMWRNSETLKMAESGYIEV